MIQVRLAESREDLAACLRLRWTVFVEEQGVRPSEELDAHDGSDAVHALASLDGVPCGAGRFVFVEPGVAKIQRMAVIDDVRGRGVGRALLAFLEEEARRRGASRLVLWAQTHARPFYERAGYAASGPEFDDAGIRHIPMQKPA
jgi:predicted GNAT family N-acyltransferase